MRRRLTALLVCLMCLMASAVRAEEAVIDTSAACPFDKDTPLFEIFFLNLGIGNDGFLLRCGGQTLLIDGGEADRTRAVQTMLDAQGIERLDMMLNTHGHEDHINAQIALLKAGYGADVFYSPYRREVILDTYKPLFPLLEEQDVAFVTVGHGDVLKLGDATLQVYRDDNPDHGPNARSLVLRVSFGERTMLLMADASGRGQQRLMEMVEPELLRVDILKVAHHGITPSKPEFLNVVMPKVAVVTNGRRYVEDTERQLAYREIDAYYTAEGTVYMATDGSRWWIQQDKD